MVTVKRPAPPNRLRLLRLTRRLNQHDVAAYLGTSQTRYWQIENSYAEPTDAEREKLAKLFGVPKTEVFPDSSGAVA